MRGLSPGTPAMGRRPTVLRNFLGPAYVQPNEMLVWTRLLLGVLILAAACSGGANRSPMTPDDAASPTAVPIPRATAAASGDYWFTGVVRDVRRECVADGVCSLAVGVLSSWGVPLADGQEVTVILSPGFTATPCLGSWDVDIMDYEAGQLIEARVGATERGELSICGKRSYYVRQLLGRSTPAPTGDPR